LYLHGVVFLNCLLSIEVLSAGHFFHFLLCLFFIYLKTLQDYFLISVYNTVH
jgi:hypothetical protein